MQFPCPWGGQNRRLASLYREGSGECLAHAVQSSAAAPSCGGSRFGCWTCTVVRKDRAGASLAERDDRYADLLAFRDWIAEIRYDKTMRWKRRRNGATGPGPLRLPVRREILRRLLVLQVETGFTLFRLPELLEIQRLWVLDGDRHDSALQLYSRFVGSLGKATIDIARTQSEPLALSLKLSPSPPNLGRPTSANSCVRQKQSG